MKLGIYKKQKLGTIAINMYTVNSSWGGSNVFVQQFAGMLKRYGYRVKFNLNGKVDIILLIDPRHDLQHKAFGIEEIIQYKRRNNEVRILHRINECDQRKGTDFMDDLLRKANEIADYTVFISEWLRNYFADKWFDTNLPHQVIYNGADPKIFHPIGGSIWNRNKPIRVVTHHWSYNPMKGFPIYQQLDDMINSGQITDCEFWVIGQWPKDMNWRSSMAIPPAHGQKLANLLRQCHLYLTASLWEPCGMHHVEGAQCGLPLVYHADGGGIVEAGKKYGVIFRHDLKRALQAARDDYASLRKKLFENMPSGDIMTMEYLKVVQRLMVNMV